MSERVVASASAAAAGTAPHQRERRHRRSAGRRSVLAFLGLTLLLAALAGSALLVRSMRQDDSQRLDAALRGQTEALLGELASTLRRLDAELLSLTTLSVRERTGRLTERTLGGMRVFQRPGDPPLSVRDVAALPLEEPAVLAHLERGGALLAVMQEQTLPRLHMLRVGAAGPGQERPLFAALVDVRSLAARENTARSVNCLLTPSGAALGCVGNPPASVLGSFRDGQTSRGFQRTRWSAEGRSWMGMFGHLATGTRYRLPGLVVFHGTAEAPLPAARAIIFNAFTPAMTLALALAAVLGLSLLWQLFQPLEPRPAPRPSGPPRPEPDTQAPPRDPPPLRAPSVAPIRPGPGLPDAVAEVDRLILSGRGRKAIIQLLLARLPALSGCDAVAVVELEGARVVRAHWRHDDSGLGVSPLVPGTVLAAAELEALREAGAEPRLADPGQAGWVEALTRLGLQGVVGLPVEGPAGLTAFLALGWRQREAVTAECIQPARALAERAALALSNAEWQEKLYHLAHYDALTQLPNRQFFIGRLDQALEQARRGQSLVGLLHLDIDGFRSINESLGSAAGDEYLLRLAEALRRSTEEDCTLARVGGDEFTFIVPELPDRQSALERTQLLAERLRSAVTTALEASGRRVALGGSMGIALFPLDAANRIDLMRCAEQALSHCKADGHGGWAYYCPDMNASALERLELAAELEGALERGEFELHFQPQVDCRSGQVTGAEALLRWRHPQLGSVPPGRFIPVAEQMGFIVPYGAWVLQESCRQLRGWRERGFEDIRLSINVSKLQLRRAEHVEALRDILHRHRADAPQLELEVTESTWLDDPESARTAFERLRECGARIAIDDFGTGYSSMNSLRHCAVDTVKIDQSFVRGLPEDSFSRSCAAATITLAHSLGASVVAEGVETEAQLHCLRGLGCEYAQGHYIAEPMSARDFETFLRNWTPELVRPLRLVSG